MMAPVRSAALAAALAFAAGPACRQGGEPASGGTGAAVGRAVVAAAEAAGAVRAPWRCALRDPVATARGAPAVGGAAPAGWRRDGDRLVAERARPRLVVAAVAQARGTAGALRDHLRVAKVDVVVAVGGMGATEAESRAALEALLDPAWLVVALPGDTEDWPAHTRAVEALAAAGGAIVDGAAIRVVDAGVAVVATLPGERWAERLAAGPEGCAHDEDDATAAVTSLVAVAGDRPRVLVTVPAPRGGASDLAPGGLHAGDPALAAAVAAGEVDLVLHGPVDATPPLAGTARRGTPVALAAGSLDPVPRRDADGRALASGAMVATVDGRGVSWKFATVK